MTTRKRRRLISKRTPWSKSRFSRKAMALLIYQDFMIEGMGLSALQFTQSPESSDFYKIKKNIDINECALNINGQTYRFQSRKGI